MCRILNVMTEDDMRKMIDAMAQAAPGMPRAMRLVLRYDAALQRITGRSEEPMYISEGALFGYLLENVLSAYPKINRQYAPGILGFTINGKPPNLHSLLLDGDIVDFFVPQNF